MKTFEQIAKEKMNNKDTIDSYNVIIHELKEQLSQKEFELKAADHVLAEKEKEIEILTNKLNNL
jgi:Mlc titration factor MtfA (ptsG expression regulator)